MKSKGLEPVLVLGEVLRPHLAAETGRKVVTEAMYLVWPLDDSTSEKAKVRFTSSYKGRRQVGDGAIDRQVIQSWMPAVGLVEYQESPAGFGTAALVNDCAQQVRGSSEAETPSGLTEVSDLLSEYFESPVRVTMTAHTGVVAVEFKDLMDLERIYWIMMSGQDQ